MLQLEKNPHGNKDPAQPIDKYTKLFRKKEGYTFLWGQHVHGPQGEKTRCLRLALWKQTLRWELCTEGFSGRALGRVACKDMEEAGMGRMQCGCN